MNTRTGVRRLFPLVMADHPGIDTARIESDYYSTRAIFYALKKRQSESRAERRAAESNREWSGEWSGEQRRTAERSRAEQSKRSGARGAEK